MEEINNVKNNRKGNNKMIRITEYAIKKFAIELLEKRGCKYIYIPFNSRKLIKFLSL